MRLLDVFSSPSVIKLLEFLASNPSAVYSQGILVTRLKLDKATLRRAVKRLEVLGLVEVDVNPVDVGLNVVRFSDETELGKAVLTLHKRLCGASAS